MSGSKLIYDPLTKTFAKPKPPAPPKPLPKGDKGDKGKDGTDGKDGKDAISLPGKDGRNGRDGRNGNDGIGLPGAAGLPGRDGREIEIRKSDTAIQWRYSNEIVWKNIIPISELKGEPGKDGKGGGGGSAGTELYSGSGAPTLGIGSMGDHYLDITNSIFYGPKKATWGIGYPLGIAATAPGGLNTQPQFNDGGAFGAMANWHYDKATGRLGIGGNVPAPTSPAALIDIFSDGTYSAIKVNQTTCCGMMLDLQRNGVTAVFVDWAGSFGASAIYFTGTSNSIRSGSFQNGFSFYTPTGNTLLINDAHTIVTAAYKIGFSSNTEIDGGSHFLDTFITRDSAGVILVNTSTNNLGTSPTVGTYKGIFRKIGYTVSTLPTGVEGDCAYVTDALAPAFGATAVGGGSVKIPVFYNGTNWIVG